MKLHVAAHVGMAAGLTTLETDAASLRPLIAAHLLIRARPMITDYRKSAPFS